jgi:hypothetical protein
MDALNFVYWLNGFAELSGDAPPTAQQWQVVRNHIALVLAKRTPLTDKDWLGKQIASPGVQPLRAEC